MQLFHFHHCKRHLKKRTIALDPLPPAYAVYTRENDDNYGRPLTINHYIGTNGIIKQLKNLNQNKATGPDELPARVLKETAEQIAPIITHIFQ